MRFESPAYLLLFLLFPAIAYASRRWRLQMASVLHSSVANLKPLIGPEEKAKRALRQTLRIGLFSLIILTLARPQWTNVKKQIETKGIDILLAIDVSGSMRALDFQPRNRLGVVKEVVADFIEGRPSDRIGVTTFSGISQTRSPLTLDTDALGRVVKQITFHEDSSTAIGVAIAAALNRLQGSNAKSRIIILLTDGSNTAGSIEPLTAADMAKALGVRVYTIGVGKKEKVPFPVEGVFGGMTYQEVKIDEETLQEISTRTDGRYYRATDPKTLEQIYDDIARLETSRIRTPGYIQYSEAAPFLLWLILIGVLFEALLCRVAWRVLP